MILLASTWLGLALLLCLAAWFAGRWVALTLPFAATIAAFALYAPLGMPIPFAPSQGEYTVLGAKIVPNVGIWVLLDDGKSEPRYYRLPYSTSSANQLQSALDGAENGQGVKAKIDGDGGQTYDGDPPVQGDEVKTPEAPAITLP